MKAQNASANIEYYVDNIDNSSINCNNVDLFALLCFIVNNYYFQSGTTEAYPIRLSDFGSNIGYPGQSSIKHN